MRFFKWLSPILVAVALLAGCGDDPLDTTPDPQPNPAPDSDISFEVALGEVGAYAVEFSVTPSDLEAEYFVTVYERRFVDAFSKDQHVVGTIYDEVAAAAAKRGLTLDEYLAESVDRGVIESVSFSGLAAETEYYILVFAVNPADGFSLVGSIERVAFTTTAPPTLECSFEVDVEVVYNTVKFQVTPSDKEAHWHLMTMSKAMYDQYVGAEGGWTKRRFYEIYLQDELQQYQAAGMTAEQIIKAAFPTGDNEVSGKGLSANTEYVYLVAAIIIEEDGSLIVATEPTLGEYTTEGAMPSDMTFNIEVWNVEQLYCEVRITPSNNDDLYCALIQPWDGVSSAEEVMNALVKQWGPMMSLMANDRGMVEHVGAKKFKLDAPDIDYYVIAFGYDGGVTTAPEMVTFRTLPSDIGPSLAEFNMAASEITTYGCKLDISSNDDTVFYDVGVRAESEYNETAVIAEAEAYYQYMYEQSKLFNALITIPEVLNTYCYNGNVAVKASGLLPESSMMGYILALDAKTGRVVRCHTFPQLFTTAPLGTAHPNIEFVACYSGDDEAGEVFGDAAATAGKALVVCRHTNLDNAVRLFYAYDVGTYTEAEYSEAALMALFDGMWQPFADTFDKPYSFLVAEWQVEYTVASCATDASGLLGRPARMAVCATAKDKSPIDELFAFIDEVYNEQSSSQPASLVFDIDVEGVADDDVQPTTMGRLLRVKSN